MGEIDHLTVDSPNFNKNNVLVDVIDDFVPIEGGGVGVEKGLQKRMMV